MGIRCADHVTPLYPQKLALTLPTGGGRSVGIVSSRTKATEFSLVLVWLVYTGMAIVCEWCGHPGQQSAMGGKIDILMKKKLNFCTQQILN